MPIHVSVSASKSILFLEADYPRKTILRSILFLADYPRVDYFYLPNYTSVVYFSAYRQFTFTQHLL
jgi:hypothetical protein